MATSLFEISEKITNIETQNTKIMKDLLKMEKQRKENEKVMLNILEEESKEEYHKDAETVIFETKSVPKQVKILFNTDLSK